jgi:uncharacterized protein
MIGFRFLTVLVLWAFVCAALARAADVPLLSGRVVDNAEILKPATREQLTATLKAHEDKTTDQVTLLTVLTIDGEAVEQYATRVFEAWKLGQKGKDNGVLVVVVPKDRKMRIEVGYGLEGTLSDVAANRIIRNLMTPKFKDGDYDQGVLNGVNAVIAQLEGNPDPAASADAPASSASKPSIKFDGPDLAWPERIVIGAFIFGVIGLFTFMGIMTPGVGWFLYVFLIPFWAMFPMVVIGTRATLVLLATYVIGYPIAKLVLSRTPWYQKAAHDLKTNGSTSIGGFVMSSSGGSSSGGGGSGFSGGGGGSSGSW